MNMLLNRYSAVTFGNVGRDGDYRPPQLVAQCKAFLLRELPQQFVHFYNQLARLLPRIQFLELIGKISHNQSIFACKNTKSLLTNLYSFFSMTNEVKSEAQASEERKKFVMAFNDTMLRIWQEQITLLGVIDTGALLSSPKALPVRADGRFFEVGLSQTFLEYGLWQDYGTGRETPRSNSGDIGRAKRRKRRRWFSRKYYASVMRLKEFYESNVGRTFCGILSSALSKDFRQNL